MKEPPIDAIKEDLGYAEQQLVEYKKKSVEFRRLTAPSKKVKKGGQ